MATEGSLGGRFLIALFAAGVVLIGSHDLLERHQNAKGWFDSDRAADILSELQADPSGRAAEGAPVEEARRHGRARYGGWIDAEKQSGDNEQGEPESGEEQRDVLNRFLSAVAP